MVEFMMMYLCIFSTDFEQTFKFPTIVSGFQVFFFGFLKEDLLIFPK